MIEKGSSKMRKLVAIVVLLGASALNAADPNYHIIKEIPIGGEGGWDYLIVDSSAHRLYVSHATKIVVADTETGQIVGEIADTPGVHGIALARILAAGSRAMAGRTPRPSSTSRR